MLRAHASRFALASALLLAGCASDPDPAPAPAPSPQKNDPGGQAQNPDPGKPDPKPGPTTPPSPSFPQAKSLGGAVIKSPKILPIVFGQDPYANDLGAFAKKLETSSYWLDVATEYGVGAVTALPVVAFDETPPAAMTNEDVKRWLEAKLADAAKPLGAPDGQTLYAIYYPAATKISFAEGGGTSCQAFGGYHEETEVGGVKVGLAVMPRCSPPPGYEQLDVLTSVSSHEFFEWATDPFPFTAPAWSRMKDEHAAWMLVAGAELSDLCTAIDYTPLKPADLGYVVQRQWSNKLSSEGHHPCAPRRDGEYFVAFPDQPDKVDLPFSITENVAASAVKVKPGTSRTITVTLYSDTPSPEPWDVAVQPYDRFSQPGSPAQFEYSLDQSSGKAGDTVKLTIKASPSAELSTFVITSRRGQVVHIWPGLVTAY
jgi:hypothetical protein